MSKIFARFLKDESGATAIEYGLIAALISVALITGATTLGDSLDETFQAISTEMSTAQGNM
ncbi:Flp family type IVb pilin [Ciceribacter sp. L1K23]|uniref:Flp family type IVb pilin n=1 Tax=unclassified Ciceribacter TaxID=2628820 RepID=UPI001ABDD026|nr:MULTISPECIES: Flp family type IVb pilin [unclassified Ciceribacter]MBO3758597.1 Flp family type IVb pilin [Ciceribacter sp. L1K22]MBR0557450.1 Flp family type IVb pilin [Ciceribacter sp. L1K23]